MEELKNYVIQNPAQVIIIAVIIAAVVAYVIYRVKNKQLDELRADAYKLMTLAEQQIVGKKKGRERLEMVVSALYESYVPAWLQNFISKKDVEAKVKSWFYDIRDVLDNVKRDKSAPPVEIEE